MLEQIIYCSFTLQQLEANLITQKLTHEIRPCPLFASILFYQKLHINEFYKLKTWLTLH